LLVPRSQNHNVLKLAVRISAEKAPRVSEPFSEDQQPVRSFSRGLCLMSYSAFLLSSHCLGEIDRIRFDSTGALMAVSSGPHCAVFDFDHVWFEARKVRFALLSVPLSPLLPSHGT